MRIRPDSWAVDACFAEAARFKFLFSFRLDCPWTAAAGFGVLSLERDNYGCSPSRIESEGTLHLSTDLLVTQPRPFFGYCVRAMESGPSPLDVNEKTLSLKGLTRSKETFAICIYPAEDDWRNLPVFIVCPWGMFKTQSESNQPVLSWPTGEWRRKWALID